MVAEPTWQPIYVDGKQVAMEAYNIAGHNYVKLRDIGSQVGFNVYWSSGVQIDTGNPYTGVAPENSGIRISSYKGATLIPMWVADMNFATVPTVQEAISERLSHPAFGYFSTREEYYQAIINWQETRNHVTGLTKECIGYENGVLGGLVSALNAFAAPGDSVLVHSPTYIGFTGSITNAGYKIVLSELKRACLVRL